MTDFRSLLDNLHRPRLLIRAARHGVQDYRRDRDLRRLINPEGANQPDQMLLRLLQEEEQSEQTRRLGDAAYCLTRHVDLLIALMAEARLYLTQQPSS